MHRGKEEQRAEGLSHLEGGQRERRGHGTWEGGELEAKGFATQGRG